MESTIFVCFDSLLILKLRRAENEKRCPPKMMSFLQLAAYFVRALVTYRFSKTPVHCSGIEIPTQALFRQGDAKTVGVRAMKWG
jgi:hypothetical protein